MAKVCLSLQNLTNICCNKHMFVMTKLLSQQAYFFVVVTSTCLSWQNMSQKYACCDKIMFVILSWQKFCHVSHACCVCHNKYLSWQKFCCDKITNIILSQQAYFWEVSWQTCVCSDRSFVMSKMRLVAAPPSDTYFLLPQFQLVIWFYLKKIFFFFFFGGLFLKCFALLCVTAVDCEEHPVHAGLAESGSLSWWDLGHCLAPGADHLTGKWPMRTLTILQVSDPCLHWPPYR